MKAAENQIKGQEFVLAKQKLEANLARMKICAEQFKLGVKLINEDAVACKNVVLTTIPIKFYLIITKLIKNRPFKSPVKAL